MMAARCYLKMRAPLSVSGKGGHRTLARVCSHVVAFHRITPRTALTMLAPWNARCTDSTGNPFPWSQAELMAALDAAVRSTPEGGVKAFQRAGAARENLEQIAAHVKLIKNAVTPGAPKVPVWRVRRLLRWFGLDMSETALGNAMRLAGVDRVRATKARIWTLPGMDYPRLVDGLLASKKSTEGGDLNKQQLVLPKTARQVEQVVSDPVPLQTRTIPAFCNPSYQPESAA